MPPDFELLEVLSRHHVPFVVIGGHAVNFHGYPRSTEDTDVVWLRSPKAELALLGALEELDARYIGSEIDPTTGIERTYPVTLAWMRTQPLMMLWTRRGFLDLFDYVPGHPDVEPHVLLDASDVADQIHYASLDWLRKMKRAAGRPKDLLDLTQLPE